MHSQLLIKAFAKAESEIQSAKPTHLAQYLSDYIRDQSGEPYGEKSLRVHYKTATKGESIDLKKFVANALSIYLGFESFEEFVKTQAAAEETKTTPNQYRWIIAGILVVLLLGFGYHQLTKKRWMVWENDHYVEVHFDEKLLQQGKLKILKKERIDYFKKIDVDCNTLYKSPEGKVQVWYGKNTAGELEYFTSLGKHPETGKTLRELSKYMFDKYVCPK